MSKIQEKKNTIVGLKDLRLNVNRYVAAVARGESFTVVRKNQPIFRLSPLDEESAWKTVIDFTKIRKGGVPIEEVLARL